jgi:hypothetical protein
MENFFASLSPKVLRDLPLPSTCASRACFRMSANGTPSAGVPLRRCTRPSVKASCPAFAPANGPWPAAVSSSCCTASAAACATAGTSEPVTIEPPESGPGGSALSPITTWMRSIGTPRSCATICASMV